MLSFFRHGGSSSGGGDDTGHFTPRLPVCRFAWLGGPSVDHVSKDTVIQFLKDRGSADEANFGIDLPDLPGKLPGGLGDKLGGLLGDK